MNIFTSHHSLYIVVIVYHHGECLRMFDHKKVFYFLKVHNLSILLSKFHKRYANLKVVMLK